MTISRSLSDYLPLNNSFSTSTGTGNCFAINDSGAFGSFTCASHEFRVDIFLKVN
ncbi:hypothetical protein O59_002176 [Cellvibrio sp. BR]|nr:hypothetical protein O59_002176 [Cellvibrio sp. BR]